MTSTIRSIGIVAAVSTLSMLCGCGKEVAPTQVGVATTIGDEGANADILTQKDLIYTVADYDPDRDAAQDLSAAVKQATADGKRILLEIGGKW